MGMDVRFGKEIRSTGCLTVCVIFFLFFGTVSLEAATYRTKNFVVSARTPDLAKEVGDMAEKCRHELSIFWLGAPLRSWSAPCPISVRAGEHLGAGGETSFTFASGEVYGWKMKVQGSRERILDSVIPHEVSHTIFASYFREPVPRWIDEGAATFVEADIERNNYRNMLVDFLKNNRGIPFNDMVSFTEYPKDQMPFYSQGFSVCEYMILVGGPRRFIEFAKMGMAGKDWSQAVHQYYGYENLGDLQVRWQGWISNWYLAGMPSDLPEVAKLAELNVKGPAASNDNIYLADNRQPGTASNQSLSPIVRGNVIDPKSKNSSSVAIAQSSPLPKFKAPLPEYPQNSNENTASSAMEPEVTFATGVGSALPEQNVVSEPLPLDESPALVASTSGENNGGTSLRLAPVDSASNDSLNYRGSYGRSLKENSGDVPQQLNSEEVKILGQSKNKSRWF